MALLNFPKYPLKFKTIDGQECVYDIIRKKYLVVGPEEIVRQHLIHFLINERAYPKALINVEKVLHLYGMRRRTDLVVFDPDGSPVMIAECKAPEITITQETFEQVSRYNLVLKVQHLLVTNGITHFCCQLDLKNIQFHFLPDIPPYETLLANQKNTS